MRRNKSGKPSVVMEQNKVIHRGHTELEPRKDRPRFQISSTCLLDWGWIACNTLSNLIVKILGIVGASNQMFLMTIKIITFND